MEWKSEAAKDRIIVALDCSGDEAVVLGEKLGGACPVGEDRA